MTTPSRRLSAPTRPAVRRWLAALGGTAVVATLLTVNLPADAARIGHPPAGPAPAGHAAADPEERAYPVALPGRFLHQRLRWKDCGDEISTKVRCATIDAPMDYRNPGAGSLKVTFSKLAASDPGKRRGVLFVNPGGPGGPGLDEPELYGDGLPAKVTKQFDLIGFDPRGVGRSTPLKCGLTGDEAIGRPPYQAENFDHDVSVARSIAAKCAAAAPAVWHISTRNTARDLDLMRGLLGERKLSYLGVSYGTMLGAVYTQLFPQHVDRIVLDSNLDPALAWRGVYPAMGAFTEAQFDEFAATAAGQDSTYHLGRTPALVKKNLLALAAKFTSHRIVVDGKVYTEQYARMGMANMVGASGGAFDFINDLRDALAGRPHSLVIPQHGEEDDATTSLQTTIFCNDDPTWPRDPQAYRDDVARSLAERPLTGDFFTNISPCAFWSSPRAGHAIKVANDVPALMVQNERDPVTPATMAQGLHRALRNSRLVMVENASSHGVVNYGRGNACAVKAVSAYLVTGKLPARDFTCAGEEQTD